MKKRSLFFIVLLLLVVVVAAGLYVFFKTDLLKTKSQIYAKYLMESSNQINNFLGPTYSTLKDYDANKVVIKLKTESTGDTYFDNGSDYIAELMVNPNEKILLGSVDLNVSMGGEDYFFKGDLELDDNVIGLKTEAFNTDKYYASSINHLDDLGFEYLKLFEDTGLDMWNDVLLKDNSDFNYTPYLNVLMKYLTDDKIEKTAFNENIIDKNMAGDKYTLTITDKDIIDIYKDLIDVFLADPYFAKMLDSKISEDVTMSDDTSTKTLRDYVLSIKSDVLEDTNVVDEENPNSYSFSLYVSNKNLVKIDYASNNEVLGSIQILNDNSLNKMQIDSSSSFYKYRINLENQIGSNEAQTTSVLTVTIGLASNRISATDSEEVEEDNYDTSMTYTVNSSCGNGTYNYSALINEDYSKSTYDVTFSKVDFEYKKLNDDNAIRIDNLTDEERSETFEKIMNDVQSYVRENPNSLLSSMMNSTSFDDYEEDLYTNPYDDEEDDNTWVVNLDEEDENEEEEEDVSTSIDMTDSINQYRDVVDEDITNAIEECLEEYKKALEIDSNTNAGDYLTVEKISSKLESEVEDLEFIDGTTIKCNCHGLVYYGVININGDLTVNVDIYHETEVTVQ